MKYISDKELLSAYIDGELSPEEQNDLEQRLGYSAELRAKLEELKKLQELTRSAIKELPESSYFETRFYAELKSSKQTGSRLRKYAPVLGFSLLAVALMVVLKLNPGMIEDMLEEQKTNIASFYKENLRPLLYAADLTNEDIFNFAFSNRIPLDNKEGQILQLGYDDKGKKFFEIRNISAASHNENNLENFAKALKLDNKQRKQVDSILASYADDLQTQILVNEKNTLAVNPNLWNYNRAIAAELLAFASASNHDEFRRMIPTANLPKKGELMQYVSEVKTARDNEYIFFTPDSIFSEVYEFDKGKFHVEMEQLNKEMKNLDKEMQRINIQVKIDSSLGHNKRIKVNKDLQVFVDSNTCRVMVPAIPPMGMDLPMLQDLEVYVNDLAENMKEFSVNIQIPDAPHGGVYKVEIGDSLNSYKFNIPDNAYMPNVDSILKYHNLDSMTMPEYEFLLQY